MSDTPAPRAHPPGWYADPMGSPRQRWWDGTRWTDDLHDPALEVYGVSAPAVLGPTTPVYNPLIWAIAVLPLLTLMASSSVDLTATLQLVLDDATAPTSPEEVTSNLVSFGVYAATVVMAFFDRRQLLKIGVTKPFHWAWAFLWSGVYVFGRSVIVSRRAGRGMTPAWVWLGIFVVSLIVGVTRMVDAVNEVFPNGSIPT
ncbi:DUF2510 domain-containing protein [Cryobacterium melibiosiphilum]|uniref:DUF2510 domain-containing protein n=1 Tax=Cryobacterium melibiosiphilum TaxID=995039 RepID=A0A3A5MQZ0_9MICO|nr:DUF2510 domain-containing protein [Cryobacterium melibiosiphilum]RJT88651.1 DUF2510 domain-containing protein [Cryobacterium melibiosiphilum]RJT89413.1 DUF2510 domain-containing protein [Cryobacterium melibiosiphilum]